MNTLKPALDMIRAIRKSVTITGKGNFDDFFAGRITHAASCSTLMDMIEFLSKSVGASIEYTKSSCVAEFIQCAEAPNAQAVILWLREHPKIAAMLARMKDEEYESTIPMISIEEIGVSDDSTISSGLTFDLPITMELLSPLAHGGDTKSGNATLFRRCQVITSTGKIMSLPFYAGNALRGILRDLLADHLLLSLGLPACRDVPAISLWFFHALYAGGVLEEKAKQSKTIAKAEKKSTESVSESDQEPEPAEAQEDNSSSSQEGQESIEKELGKRGALQTDGFRRLRNMLPGISILGTAAGNKIICGRIYVGDLRPQCQEWGTGNIPVAQIMDWEFLTRRDDYEGRGIEDAHAGMIANTEVIKTGVSLVGGIDVDNHASDLEKSALGAGLSMLKQRGFIGAGNRRGFGKAKIHIDNLPDPAPYQEFLSEKKEEILGYMKEIGALANAPR